ncbi:MAG TPA: hypothetical protein VMF57_19580 [Solirubrobacteraceae bacterium]|nr:hypothetical protein [Solirubrobacteraceae bacterium]
MTTLLLTRGPDPRVVQVRRCGVCTRLVARARARALDQALLKGTSPDSSAALSLRAQSLIGTSYRLGLANELRGLVRAAGKPAHRFDPVLPVPGHVRLVLDLVEQVGEMLEGGEAVDARGVARLELLLRDGSGPIYATGGAAALRLALQQVLDALVVSARITADA